MFSRTKERIATVQAIPSQVRFTVTLAISAFIVALIALSMSMVVSYRAN